MREHVGKKCNTGYSVEYETVYITEHKKECTTKYNTKALETTQQLKYFLQKLLI